MNQDYKGHSKELLKALHILTNEGRINHDSNRKIKQVHHLAQLIIPELESIYKEKSEIKLIDAGAGKSYLGFLLWDLWLKTKENISLYNIESRKELVETGKKIATDFNAQNIFFSQKTIVEATVDLSLPVQIDVLLALHACDIATDEAIHLGLEKNAKLFFLVPCCQAEVASQLKGDDLKFSSLWRFGILKREFGSHLTNVIRALYLESKGYKVRVTEFTGLEHSLKNQVIIAVKHQQSNSRAERQLENLLNEFHIKMKLVSK